MKVMGLFSAFALCGLFLFAMLNFGFGIQENYNVNNTILSHTGLNETFADLDSELSGFDEQATAQWNATSQEQVTESFGSLLLGGIGNAVKTFTSMVTSVYNIVIVQSAGLLGIPPVVVTLLTSFLMVMIVLMLWRVIRTGE
jgi:hypothetical protein|tara:strand:+ start:265 stop:690 length:426 start_codon:yes stop_codon:yes gene_type:complete